MSKPDYNLSFNVTPEVQERLSEFHMGKAISNNLMEETELHAICTTLIVKSRWASWLHFSWMHSLAASYYARKARRIYNAKKVAGIGS